MPKMSYRRIQLNIRTIREFWMTDEAFGLPERLVNQGSRSLPFAARAIARNFIAVGISDVG